jgi:RNA polymerase sigma factor (sigma-70 family)
MTNDLDLLGQFTRDHSQDAFTALVNRHVNLVYSAALRQVRSPQLAEEVAQSVFTDLARNAGKLKPDTVLTAWLYQVTRCTAIDVVRRETRRQLREQIASEMNAMNATASDWTQIEPFLDEAMHTLDETDRAAVLLRYFENKSLREVGESLGASEDAAQKRVSRAVERLREFFTKRGVTVGASGLVAVISVNAVQAAPVGLAVTISTAAILAGTTITTTATATATKAMALTNIKIITAAIVAALSIPLALVLHQNASLRHEITALRASVVKAARPPDTITQSGSSENELQRLRKEHLELLSLRGRVTQLAKELRERKAGGPSADTNPNPASEPTEADSILFSASLTNRVGAGQTLVAGGWSKDGMRGYLLATPVIQQVDNMPDGRQISIKSQVVGAPESFWNQIGWGAAKSDTRRSTLASVLTPEQLDMLLKALKETKGAFLSNTALAKRRDGEYLGIGYNLADDQTIGMLMAIDVYPWIAGDGQSVDLEIRPSAVSTNTPIHPFLKPAGQSASPSAQ